MAQCAGELAGLDILVNTTAYQLSQPDGLAAISTEQFDRVMKTNLYAMFWLCRALLPHLRPGSLIINTASVQGPQPSNAPLSESRRLHLRWARVLCVSPVVGGGCRVGRGRG
nr:SDR family NAD(P)-dependent oxidoreductase [Streptomyces sp. TLI_235]